MIPQLEKPVKNTNRRSEGLEPDHDPLQGLILRCMREGHNERAGRAITNYTRGCRLAMNAVRTGSGLARVPRTDQ